MNKTKRKIERELKFSVEQNLLQDIENYNFIKVGIAQWYKNPYTRFRLAVDSNGNTKWKKTTKKSDRKIENNSNIKYREEITTEPTKSEKEDLYKHKMVAKWRYYLDKNKTISIDDFIFPNSASILEIEFNKEEFEKYKKIGSNYVKDILINKVNAPEEFKNKLVSIITKNNDKTKDPRFENHNISKVPKNRFLYPLKDNEENEIQKSTFYRFLIHYAGKPVKLLITVGLSGFMKFKDKNWIKEINDSEKTLKEALDSNKEHIIYKRDNDNTELTLKDLHEINNWKDFEKFRGWSAELDIITDFLKVGYNIKQIEFVHFTPSNLKIKKGPMITNIAEKLVEEYSKVLKKWKEFESLPISIETENKKIFLDTKDNSSTTKFTKEFLNLITKEKERCESKDISLLLDLTGGHKFAIAIGTIYSSLLDIESMYKQEGGKHVNLPILPIKIDTKYIDEYKLEFSKLSQERSVSFNEALPLNHKLRSMLILEKNEKYRPLGMYEYFMKSYMEDKEQSMGFGKSFIDLIKDKRLGENLKNSIKKYWSLIWMGDQIPETVEHSQRHSKRLMEFATALVNVMGENMFLSYKNEENNKFTVIEDDLQPYFYYILGAAMNIHDIGHSAMNYESKYGKIFLFDFPMMVRDLHNILTYSLLESTNSEIINDTVNNAVKEIKALKHGEKLLDAIKLLSVYHRQAFKIEEDFEDDEKYFKLIKEENLLSPLIKNDIFINHFENSWKNMVKLAVMYLKFIDGCDIQSDRIVTDYYSKVREERTKYEEAILRKRFEEINKTLEKSSDLINNIRSAILEENKERKFDNDLYEHIEEVLNSNGNEYTFYSLASKISFKKRQFDHFKKHKSVKFIYPESFSNNKLTIRIKFDENVEDSVKKSIKKEIMKEFKKSGLETFSSIKNLNIKYST